MVRIFGVTYGNRTTEYEPYDNSNAEKPWRFENEPMCKISDSVFSQPDNLDLVGVFSHAFRSKTGISKMGVIRFLNESKKADVYNYCKGHGPKIHFMNWSDDGHKGIKSMIQRCCNHLGMEYNNDPKHVIYANQFVASKHVYVSYINEVIKPCIELLEGPMWEEINRNPGYTRAKEGVEYTYLPFILERMMMQYVHNRNLVCNEYFRK